ncbi:hypothetical protein CYMTET_43273 [Cymbomonas tetramitiformis]|uniref:Uncharacterized protein n=1 Tax=Cymbomonas tetramitiformis TaxID=36881 RepID=A0AAE0C4D9_9CHLO|nr:hypothetical protein CYMTET_43273 [Cymbomonas tetramitiformis]
MATEPKQQVVLRHGGASATVSGVPAGYAAQVSLPAEEFPGGVDLVPLRHPVPSTALGAPFSAVACSFEQSDTAFAELEEKSERSANRGVIRGLR